MAPTAAIRRGSFCNDSSVWVGSVDIFFSDADVTGLPAIRTIIQSIHAKANTVLRLAEAAILLADALRLRLIALRADDGHLDDLLVKPTRAIHSILGQDAERDKRVCPSLLQTRRARGSFLARHSRRAPNRKNCRYFRFLDTPEHAC